VGAGWACPSLDFENFSTKRLFSYFRVGKNKFHHFLAAPLGNILEESPGDPPGKNPSDAYVPIMKLTQIFVSTQKTPKNLFRPHIYGVPLDSCERDFFIVHTCRL